MSGRPHLGVRYDLRLPQADGPERKRFLDVALDQIAWAEGHGFGSVTLSEHHGSTDGYLPSPLIFGAAVAARTSSVFIHIGALIAPLHDPLRLAEDLAVLDLLSGGRLIVTIGAGYVASEFEMFGKELGQRGNLVTDAVTTLRAAWTGEPFDHRGRTVRVTPRPYQEHVLVLMGGQTPAAARRAARIADGYAPVKPELFDDYRAAVVDLGRPDPGPMGPIAPRFVYVSEDPERAWTEIGGALMHETNAYAAWADAAGLDTGYYHVDDLSELQAMQNYCVLTPDECRQLCTDLGAAGTLILHPLAGGLDPDLSWSSLELFANKVLPQLS
jgi:alkanesulfonate monooxygenase SsuD/methylene tetrahydromethanopterin reductase-like flavin-dependent oxidoreductase (luciferase family)